MRLSVYVFSMTNCGNSHDSAGIVNLVQDSVVAGSNTPRSLSALQFLAPRRPWISAKGQQSLLNQLVGRRRDCKMFFLSPAENYNGIVHLRLRRFSARACSRGMAVSPEAFASSIARMSSRSSSSSRSFSYSSTLMTTAILSPFSFVRNWVGCFISSPHQSLAQPQTGSKKGDIAVNQLASSPTDQAVDQSSSEEEATLSTARKASCGMST